jgi:hypothetical protein
MIQGCRYLRRSTDRWLLSKNSTTRLEGLESLHGAGLLRNCSIPITNTKGPYLYPCSNTTPSRPRLQHLLPKIDTPAPMSVLHPSSIRPFFIFKPRHHAFPNASSSKRKTALLPNVDTLPTADVFTECFEENLLPNGVFSTKLGPQVSLFPVPIFGVNTSPTRAPHHRYQCRLNRSLLAAVDLSSQAVLARGEDRNELPSTSSLRSPAPGRRCAQEGRRPPPAYHTCAACSLCSVERKKKCSFALIPLPFLSCCTQGRPPSLFCFGQRALPFFPFSP